MEEGEDQEMRQSWHRVLLKGKQNDTILIENTFNNLKTFSSDIVEDEMERRATNEN